MFGRYVARRVLSIGPLRSVGARILLLLALLTFTGGGAVIAYQFLRPAGGDLSMWAYVHDVSTISIAMLTTGAFLGLRLILSSAESFLALTYQLPVTHHERRAAMMGFEILSLAALITLLMAGMTSATLMVLGWSGVWLATTPFLTALTCYLLLSVLHNLGDRLLSRIGIVRTRQTILLLLIFAGLLLFSSQVPELIASISYVDAEQRALLWVNLLPWLVSTFGPAPLLTAVLLLPALWLLALVTAPVAPPANTRFVNVALPWRPRGAWGLHLAYSLRNGQLWLGVALCLALFIYLIASEALNPLWSAVLLVVPGMYHYGNTRGARVSSPEGSAPAIWLRIVSSEFAVLGSALLVLTAVTALLNPALLSGAWTPILGVLGAALFSVLVGCAFPAENDNPFSVLAGVLVVCLCLGFVGIVTGLLRLPGIVTIPLLVVLHLVAAAASILSIHINESRTRYKTVPANTR
ncbi:MAG TPA: hypothetical protein PKE40_03310 [Arachnia sp.]|nr:hypothetical protein [Arachnia sp.]HMT85358.1 hypothetical protein [Arachnia sp.]